MELYNVTLNQIAYEVFEVVRGELSDDEDTSLDMIKDMIHDTRAKLLKQKFDKNARVIDDVFTQSLGALQIEAVDASAHSTIKAGRYMYRTVREIPPTIDRTNYEGTFTRIGPADKLATPYSLVSYDRALYSGNGRFNKDQIFVFLRDNKLYLISNSGAFHKAVQFIDVVGVFQNPAQVATFLDSNGDSLYADDKTYPVSRSLKEDIQEIVKKKIVAPAQAPTDKINDGDSSIK